MNPPVMSSLERVLTALSHKEPDRVPFFLLLSMHGAREMGMSIREYFATPGAVATAQLRMRGRYGHDCLYAFQYAAVEVEAMGGEVIFRDDGPPNAGEPILKSFEDVRKLAPARVKDCPCLQRVLAAIEGMAAGNANAAPIIGVVMSPFSLPVMQLGFENYLILMHEQPALFERLMQINEEFCVEWANAQCAAGAHAICYFDPVSSSTLIPPALYRRTGWEVAKRVLPRIQAPVATHLASGRCLPIIEDLAASGTAVIGVGAADELAKAKAACAGRVGVLGNMNVVEMRRWTPADAEQAVRTILREAASGGGFVLSDSHGEIPWQVSEDVLMAIADAVRRWGRYPLDWIDHEG